MKKTGAREDLSSKFIFIVGAGRSGTTMLKEALAAHAQVSAPEYELNHVWRHGNAALPHDMLDPDRHLNPRIKRGIQRNLEGIRRQSGSGYLVEKTVANVMRLNFVQAVFPKAKMIHIIRDGRAVTASAILRWQARPGRSYLWAKSRTVPLSDRFLVGLRYLKSRLLTMKRRRNYRQSWGPRWPEMDRDALSLSLPELCAKQWTVSVETALDQSTRLPKDQYLEMRYEAVVTDPHHFFSEIAAFIGLDGNDAAFKAHVKSRIHRQSLNKWESLLDRQTLSLINPHMKDLMTRLGYD